MAAAFNDIHPKAAVHVLIVPKAHHASLDDLNDPVLGGHLLEAVRTVAKQLGVDGAYRLAMNNGKPAGQVIEHLHFHLLAQRGGDFATPGAETDTV